MGPSWIEELLKKFKWINKKSQLFEKVGVPGTQDFESLMTSLVTDIFYHTLTNVS